MMVPAMTSCCRAVAELIPVANSPFEPSPDAVITSGAIIGGGFVSAAKAQSWTYRWALPKDTMTMAVNGNIGDFVILSNSDDTGAGRFLIDDVALFKQNPAARTAWLTVWGIDTSTYFLVDASDTPRVILAPSVG
jgi:hypothetical protein